MAEFVRRQRMVTAAPAKVGLEEQTVRVRFLWSLMYEN